MVSMTFPMSMPTLNRVAGRLFRNSVDQGADFLFVLELLLLVHERRHHQALGDPAVEAVIPYVADDP